MKTKNKIDIQVFDFNNQPIENAKIEMVKVTDSNKTTQRKLSVASVTEEDETYEVIISAPGLEPQKRIITSKEKMHSEIFILGKKGMPSFYRGKVKVPFEAIDDKFGVVLENYDSSNKLLLQIEKKYKLKPFKSTSNLSLNNMYVFEYPKGITEKEKYSLKEKIQNETGVSIARPILKFSERNAILLTDEIIVKFKTTIAKSEINTLITKHGLETLRVIPYSENCYHFKVIHNIQSLILSICEDLVVSGVVEYAEPNVYASSEIDAVTPNNYLYKEQWDYPIIGMPNAWEQVRLALNDTEKFGNPDIVVASIDPYGTDVTHEHFSGNVSNGQPKLVTAFDFSTMLPNNNTILITHGTSCSSAAVGYTTISSGGGGVPNGTVGVAGNCRLLAVRSGGNEARHADMYIWLAGFDPLSTTAGFPSKLAKGVDVITNSYGFSIGAPTSGLMSDVFDFLTSYGRDGKGVALFFSAGNGGAVSTLLRPWGNYVKCMSITASSLANDGITEIFTPYSNFSPQSAFCAPSNNDFSGFHGPPNIYGAFTGSATAVTQIAQRVTTLFSAYVAASTNLNTVNASTCLSGDLVIIEGLLSPNVEFRRVLAVNYGTNVLTIDLALNNPHIAGASITFIDSNAPRNRELQTAISTLAVAGSNVISVNSTAGMAVLQAIVIGNPSVNISSSETKIITQITPNTIRFFPPLFNAHNIGTVVNYGLNDYRNNFGGTSYATPVTAGIAALMLSVNKNLTWLEIRQILRDTAIKIDPTNASPTGRWIDRNGVPFGGGGYLGPFFSQFYGYGRVDAAAAVTAAKNFNHDQRDLIIRDYINDDGRASTNIIENPINSPDIWSINAAPPAAVNPLLHGLASHTPVDINTSGDTLHKKVSRSAANITVYSRVYNRGTGDTASPIVGDPIAPVLPLNQLNYSIEYESNIFLALKDIDITNPLVKEDYIDGPTTSNIRNFVPLTPAQVGSPAAGTFNLNLVPANGTIPGTTNLLNFKSSFALLPASLIPAQKGRIFHTSLTQAQRPRLPYSYVMYRTTVIVNAGDSVINMEHTRGLTNGQQILIGRPGDANYRLATINVNPTINTITINGTAGNVYPVGTFIIRLESISTQLNGATAAAAVGEKVSILNVDSVTGFKIGNYVISGALPDAANNRFHRIVRVIRNTAPLANQLIIEPPLTSAMADNTLLTQVGGRLKTFILAEVTPYDGVLAGNKPEENNNISYKEVKFEHEVLFKDTTGNLDLPTRIQVANAGGVLTTNFRIYVKDADNFNPEEVTITVTRKLTNGNFETETYFYKTTAPIGWTMLPAAPAWLVLNAPLITATNAAAPITTPQTDIYFTGSFNADNTIEEIQITVNVLGNDAHPLGARDFVTSETFVGKVFVINNLPNVNDANLQDQTGMPALAGTQMLHAFADMTSLEQTPALSFGPKSNSVFRLTSSFNTNANPGAVVNAFAVIDGIVFIQRNVANNTINLVIKPLKQSEIGFSRVKYFIYRGLKEEDFFTAALPDRVIVNAAPNPNAHFVDSIIATQNLLNPGQPVKLTALGWDPTTQALNDSLDDFFFNSNPNNQLPVVKRGMSLGRFKNQEFGFEIVLAEGAYPISLASLQQNSYSIDVSAIANADERAAKREEVLNYIDPAAYYGMHYLSGILYPVLPDPSPANIDTILKSKVDLYTLVVSKFATKNTLYIDIRNENGYSYNYYGNYTQTSGSDLGKAIRIGFVPPAQLALTTSRYVSQDWPLMIYDNALLPENNPENMSAAYLQLSTADNGNPIAFFEYGNAVTATTQNNYAETTNLLETLDITNIIVTIASSTITVTGDASALNIGDIFYVISCDHQATNAVYKVANKLGNVITVENGTLVHNIASGPALGKIHFQKWTKVIAISHPNHPTANPNQKLNVAHVLKLRYFRQQHETGKSIIAIDQPNKKFVVQGLIPRLLKAGDKLIVCNASTTNNGTYTIAANGVLQIGSDTHITVTEAIPAAFSIVVGANNGIVKIKPSLVPATVHYTDHKFGSLNGITRLFKIIAINPVSAVQAVITIAGDYRHVLSRNLRISIINATTAVNNGSYAVTSGSAVLAGVNTTITITTTTLLSATINLASTTSDFMSVLAMPWRSDLPTQWISGFDFRYLDVKKQLTDAAGNPKDGFAYMGQTGVAIEQSRIIFQMTPLNFFAPPSVAYSPNIINMNGGTSSTQSFWKLMQTQNQNLVLNATMLKINPGAIIVPVFDFVDDTADAIADDPIKSNFLSLCITQTEFQRLKDVSDAQLNSLHDLYIVLRKEKNLVDVNNVNYKTFELAVSGFSKKADNSLVANEVYPTVPIVVYALREDSVIFTSKDFADVENTETVRASFEETKRVNAVPLNVYALNPTIQAHVNTFNTDLIALNHDYVAITALVQARAQSLWAMATAAADAGGLRPYDDRQLYWARLHARNAIREHATLRLQFGRRKRLMQLFEEHSRGFRSISYTAAPVGAVKILVVGFDPFRITDNEQRSNPAGSIALYLDGKTLTKGIKQGYVQSIIFPVRFGDFDAGLVERMIKPYMSGVDKVDMIVTCSMDIINYFNIDRFASKFRGPDSTDNESKKGNIPKYYKILNDGRIVKTSRNGLPEFIETTLPFDNMNDTVGNTRPINSTNQIAVFKQTWAGKLPSGATTQNVFDWNPNNLTYNPANAEVPPAINIRATEGSGGTYLSNEIFYRVSLMRTTVVNSVAKTGHLHVPLIQNDAPDDFSTANTTTLVQNARTIITDALSSF